MRETARGGLHRRAAGGSSGGVPLGLLRGRGRGRRLVEAVNQISHVAHQEYKQMAFIKSVDDSSDHFDMRLQFQIDSLRARGNRGVQSR